MSPSSGSGWPSPATILVVDDEPANAAALVELLRPSHSVRVATTGMRALALARAEPPPDLILLDVVMPGLDGYAVLAELQAESRTRSIPVVFVTSLTEVADEERGLALGAVDYITKPLRPPIVLARVRTHLALNRARRDLERYAADLEGEVDRRGQENALVQDVSLGVIAGLVESRDADTGNHTMRTRAYVEVLAQRLVRSHRLDSSRIARIVKAAPLHDIGKIGIPDTILLKPGPLTTSEFAVMKTHSRIGGEAIARAIERAAPLVSHSVTLAFLEEAREIALWHHERWSGGGYPDGLSGTAIPLGARLMAVADVFDALTTQRVYKDALPIAEATRVVTDGAGQHFDPDIVAAFVAAADELAAVARRYGDGAR